MAAIASVRGREILDSRGNPTVEVAVTLDDGVTAVASVPSGASTGSQEALELRDGDTARYGGKGVLQALGHVNTEIAEAVQGMPAEDQAALDQKMRDLDGTENKSRLGANAILGVSLAVARAAAQSAHMPLYHYLGALHGAPPEEKKKAFPIPLFNIINGGEHADSGLSVQEFKIVPEGVAGYPEQLRAGSEVFHALQKIFTQEGFTTAVGDEGGFAPRVESHTAVFEVLLKAIEAAGYQPGKEIFLDIDAAANSFYDKANNVYHLLPEKVSLSRESLITLYRDWTNRFPLCSIEDPLHEEDWEGWRMLQEKITKKIMIVGDDLLVTNVKRVEKAIREKACNSVLVKVNQIGTLTETLACVRLAQENGMNIIISHRSGETTDDFIADLAVGVRAEYIKTGSLSRGERVAKYNRLLHIYQEIFPHDTPTV